MLLYRLFLLQNRFRQYLHIVYSKICFIVYYIFFDSIFRQKFVLWYFKIMTFSQIRVILLNFYTVHNFFVYVNMTFGSLFGILMYAFRHFCTWFVSNNSCNHSICKMNNSNNNNFFTSFCFHFYYYVTRLMFIHI
jgi:hypothetical protein